MFADREGYVGVFDGVYGIEGGRETNDDPLADDSLLMEVYDPFTTKRVVKRVN